MAPKYTMTQSTPHPVPDDAAARAAADVLLGVFDAHQAQFRLVTRRAGARFLRRDWAGAQRDATERH
jgi:isocitrate dehydrogenase kinase/phosphatase